MRNNKKEIFIIIIATFFSVIIMIFNFDIRQYNTEYINQSSQNNEDNYLEADKTENKNVGDILSSEESQQILKNNDNENIDISIKENEEDLLDRELVDSTYEYIEAIEENGLDNTEDKESIATKKEATQSVFKIDKNSIMGKISNVDKLKIMKMANSLSVSDYKELINNIKRNDELLAAMDIFQLLKNKLSHKQYRELIQILDPYIYTEVIENKINQK